MDMSKPARSVYRDFEKLYRLLTFYDGNLGQLAPHLKMIDQSLCQELEKAGGSGFTYELMMSRVICLGEEVYSSDTPEMTMVYRLYSEGVKSITLLPRLRAEELLNWLVVIRNALVAGQEDLGALLWRSSCPNIRVALYNALIQSDGLAREFLLDSTDLQDVDSLLERENRMDAGEGSHEGTKLEQETSEHDPYWELPKVGHAFHSNYLSDLDEKKLNELYDELSDISITDRSKSIVKFHEEEIRTLHEELQNYDATHVEFNLILREFSILASGTFSQHAQDKAKESLTALASSVIEKFHGGMILLYLQKLEKLSKKESHLTQELSNKLQEILVERSNAEILTKAFEIESRKKIAIKLTHYMTPVQWTRLIDWMIEHNMTNAAQNFLSGLARSGVDLEKAILGWGRDRLIFILPILGGIQWDKKNDFLKRCLGSRFAKISSFASRSIAGMDLRPAEAKKIYRGLPEEAKTIWAKTFFNEPTQSSWIKFMEMALEEGLWIDDDSKRMEAWVLVFVKYLGTKATSLLEPLVKSRAFFFLPKYPREREAILNASFQTRNLVMKKYFDHLVENEGKLLFQSSELKERLR